MCEKEAEEYAKQFMKTYSESDKFINCKRETDNYNVMLEQGYELGFQKGAVFGYNKANEWHYVKDGDLPNKGVLCAVLLVNKDLIFARLREDNVWTTNGHNAFENVIAWKEIVLPELKENE